MLCGVYVHVCEDVIIVAWVVFFQAEGGIRDLVRSRGLGDVYKRQAFDLAQPGQEVLGVKVVAAHYTCWASSTGRSSLLSLIHI